MGGSPGPSGCPGWAGLNGRLDPSRKDGIWSARRGVPLAQNGREAGLVKRSQYALALAPIRASLNAIGSGIRPGGETALPFPLRGKQARSQIPPRTATDQSGCSVGSGEGPHPLRRPPREGSPIDRWCQAKVAQALASPQGASRSGFRLGSVYPSVQPGRARPASDRHGWEWRQRARRAALP